MKRSKIASAETSPIRSGSQSLRAKLSKPFASRKRHVAGFFVQTEDPYRSYSPGDPVKGSVVLEVDRFVDITHLTVCLHGCVKVLTKALPPGQNIPSDSTLLSPSKKQGPGYFGNGFASLFEHEEVLCGEGRLEIGRYRFSFEITFPSKGFPSSIDFERGTITYLISATLTRPSSINPVTSCHHKIKFTDDIDISLIPSPKPRASTLLPGRRKSVKVATNASIVSDPQSGSMRDPQGDREEGQATSPPDEISSVEPPESPASSEISTTSATSSSRSWHLATSSSVKLNQVGADSIHAVLELSQGGCLPGDRVAIQINVKHVKPIKNMNGIIVTFFRTCRVDTHPDLPLGPVRKGSKLEYEDYYPRSKTGLGGLSLSSAGSHKTFRQDLNQVFEPLIIDPKSLTAQIKTHIKIPDEIFPSITSVPGSMISFKYEIEVLVDLRGRMAGQDYIRSQIGMINVPRGHGFGDPKKHGVDGSTGLVFPLASGFGCLDTSQMRREKFVISRTFGIVVGTRDSERIRLRKLGKQAALTPAPSVVSTPTQERLPELSMPHSVPVQASRLGSPLAEHDEYFPHPDPSTTVTNDDNLPPPVWMADESLRDGLDEKTRLRNAEARLLPSAPPADDSLSRSDELYLEPTAPPASDDMMYEQYESLQPVTSASEHSLATVVPAYSAPAYNASSGIEATEESRAFDPYGSKEELEYRRLQQQASSPDDNMEVDSSAARKLEPSAPPEEDASFTEGQNLSNGIEESTASEEHFATVLDDGIEAEQTLGLTGQLQRGSSQVPPQASDDLEPSAPVLSDDDELYETHPAPAPPEAEHLPVYHK